MLFILSFIIGISIQPMLVPLQLLAAYIGKEYYAQISLGVEYNFMMVLPLLLVGIVLVLFGDKNKLHTVEYRSLYFGVIFNNLLSVVNNSDRTVVYYLFPLIVLIPNVYVQMKKHLKLKTLICILFFSYFSYKYFKVLITYMGTNIVDSPVPYKSCLF